MLVGEFFCGYKTLGLTTDSVDLDGEPHADESHAGTADNPAVGPADA